MKIELKNIDFMLPSENTGVARTLSLEDDEEYLNITFIGDNDDQGGFISMTKKQTILLRDSLTTFINNRLIDLDH